MLQNIRWFRPLAGGSWMLFSPHATRKGSTSHDVDNCAPVKNTRLCLRLNIYFMAYKTNDDTNDRRI